MRKAGAQAGSLTTATQEGLAHNSQIRTRTGTTRTPHRVARVHKAAALQIASNPDTGREA